jgi:hypothetical protein
VREKVFALERLENGACVFGSQTEQPGDLRDAHGESGHFEKLVAHSQRILFDGITWDDHRHTSRFRNTGNRSWDPDWT